MASYPAIDDISTWLREESTGWPATTPASARNDLSLDDLSLIEAYQRGEMAQSMRISREGGPLDAWLGRLHSIVAASRDCTGLFAYRGLATGEPFRRGQTFIDPVASAWSLHPVVAYRFGLAALGSRRTGLGITILRSRLDGRSGALFVGDFEVEVLREAGLRLRVGDVHAGKLRLPRDVILQVVDAESE